jgi:hypothetical protein
MAMNFPEPKSRLEASRAKTLGRPRAETGGQVTLRQKTQDTLADPNVTDLGSFLYVFYRSAKKDQPLPNPRELGHLLAYLRENGRLSPEIDGFMADQLADAVLRRLDQEIKDGSPLIAQIESLAQAEPSDPVSQNTTFATYRALAARARQIETKSRLGKPITDAEQGALEDFKAFQFLVADETPPATLVAHFIGNGDLRWLWGLDNKIDLRQFKLKTQGGKLGGRETAEW